MGFWYCDLPFDELLWDARVKAHFWLPPDARVTIDLFYERIHPDDREATRRSIDDSISNHRTYDVIYRTVSPDHGGVKHVRAMGGALYATDGHPIRFDGVTLDVTELREADRNKDEFLATLAHELRNPLAPIRTGLELLAVTPEAGRASRTITMMQRQLHHLVRLVDDLLDIARISNGKIVLLPQPIDARTLIETALETTHSALDARGHTVEQDLGADPLPLLVDATRIAQVLANLLSNAVKYTPPGGKVQITARRDGAWIELVVADNGIGMPPDRVPQIFEMFTQLAQSIDRASGGLGIGLTLARRLVEMHGGTITATSAGVGTGSVFSVRLPAAAAPTVAPTESPRAAAPGGLRVLVVDDNVDAADVMAMLLESAGNEVHVAHSGPEALTVAAAHKPSVVLLDIGLPGIDGYEVARRLRADATLPPMRLIALTGWGAEEDRRKAKEAGFDHHLVKPVDQRRLFELLRA